MHIIFFYNTIQFDGNQMSFFKDILNCFVSYFKVHKWFNYKMQFFLNLKTLNSINPTNWSVIRIESNESFITTIFIEWIYI